MELKQRISQLSKVENWSSSGSKLSEAERPQAVSKSHTYAQHKPCGSSFMRQSSRKVKLVRGLSEQANRKGVGLGVEKAMNLCITQ